MLEFLAPEQVHALRGLVEVMLDPLSPKLAMTPIEDEEISEEEERARGGSQRVAQTLQVHSS